jgi:hypothetical protein
MDDHYSPHYAVEICIQGRWHPVAWFVCLEDARLFHGWLSEKYPKESYRIVTI